MNILLLLFILLIAIGIAIAIFYHIPAQMTGGSELVVSMHIFEHDLRIHDNPTLLQHINSDLFYPVYVITTPSHYNSYPFIIECLHDLDASLRRLGSHLLVLTRAEADELGKTITLITHGHRNVLCDEYTGKPPATYQSFIRMPRNIRPPVNAPTRLPPCDRASTMPNCDQQPFLQEDIRVLHGGESAGLARLAALLTRPVYLAEFSKPDTPFNSPKPSTSQLSPYLAQGCLSVVRVWNDITSTVIPITKPPESFIGQLLWREYFYWWSTEPDFLRPDRPKVPWSEISAADELGAEISAADELGAEISAADELGVRNASHLAAFKMGQTGFPLVDAAMSQLRQTGWIHHLARHLVACFLTRGDLWIDWREGVAIFDEYLLDTDYALNNANWQWVSGSRWFRQYWKVYSPHSYQKANDPAGAYIRKWCPTLKDFPKEYIYMPWTAPLDVQTAAGCIIGKDYPRPIVDHAKASKANMTKMKK
jgi:cryptochrome